LRDFVLNLSLEVPSGVTLVTGPSGSGKTTLLRLIAGLAPVDSGSISLNGRVLSRAPGVHLAPRDRDVALLFQEYALFPHLSVAQNVAYGLEARGVDRAGRDRRVASMMERLGIDGLAGERTSKLSGGQRQRVALARALVLAPSAILLDEPMASLDLQTRIAVRREIGSTLQGLGIPALMVSHDPADAAAFSDRIAVIEDGLLVAHGTFDALRERPATSFIEAFVSEAPAAQTYKPATLTPPIRVSGE
jgi:putative spermidine/putrescine transport system ATP-binding protein